MTSRPQRLRGRSALVIILGLLIGFGLAGILLCEITVRLPRRSVTDAAKELAETTARALGARLETVEISGRDGVPLRAWFFRKNPGQRRTVLLMHGQGDNRAAMIPFAALFLRRGFDALSIDCRAHGDSGGDLAGYGLVEVDDVRRWIDWLDRQPGGECLYGLGESMGAAILLQSLRHEKRFCAVAAESPFSSLREIAYDRVASTLGARRWLGATALRPIVETGFFWARLRYGLDFDLASAEEAVASAGTPVLLIHGTADTSIPPRHSRRILQRRSHAVELWEVPGAGHTAALGSQPLEFERRVCGWFERYDLTAPAGASTPEPGRARQ